MEAAVCELPVVRAPRADADQRTKESGADAFQVKSVSQTRFLDRLGKRTPGQMDDVANAIAIYVGPP